MRLFISWSGERSRLVAAALSGWLPSIFPTVQPFFSPEIEKGSKWGDEIDTALEGTSFGIVCLTPENLKSEWVHYEAGALSKLPGAKIWTLLVGVRYVDVVPPLSRFQHTEADESDIWLLIVAINAAIERAGGAAWKEDRLQRNFALHWPDLATSLDSARSLTFDVRQPTPLPEQRVTRADAELLREVLEIVRTWDRRLARLEAAIGSPWLRGRSYADRWAPEPNAPQGIHSARIGVAYDSLEQNRLAEALRAEFPTVAIEPYADPLGLSAERPATLVRFGDTRIDRDQALATLQRALNNAGLPDVSLWLYQQH